MHHLTQPSSLPIIIIYDIKNSPNDIIGMIAKCGRSHEPSEKRRRQRSLLSRLRFRLTTHDSASTHSITPHAMLLAAMYPLPGGRHEKKNPAYVGLLQSKEYRGLTVSLVAP